MYEYLEGRLVSHHPARVVLDVGGVGYDLAVPLGVHFGECAEGRVRVWAHLIVREDSHRLFGFPERGMRDTFRMLLGVRGVGPGMALAVLSRLPGEALVEALANEDLAALTRIKGVGKKTAQQIMLDLRDKGPVLSATLGTKTIPSPTGAADTAVIEDAVSALLSIGYTDKQARSSVENAAREVQTSDLEELVRAALRD